MKLPATPPPGYDFHHKTWVVQNVEYWLFDNYLTDDQRAMIQDINCQPSMQRDWLCETLMLTAYNILRNQDECIARGIPR